MAYRRRFTGSRRNKTRRTSGKSKKPLAQLVSKRFLIQSTGHSLPVCCISCRCLHHLRYCKSTGNWTKKDHFKPHSCKSTAKGKKKYGICCVPTIFDVFSQLLRLHEIDFGSGPVVLQVFAFYLVRSFHFTNSPAHLPESRPTSGHGAACRPRIRFPASLPLPCFDTPQR